MTARAYAQPALIPPRGARPGTAAAAGLSLAHQAARAQALLDRIALVSEQGFDGTLGEDSTVQLLRALDEREALLTELAPVVAELSVVRGQLARQQGDGGAEARALDLVLAPVEKAARKALDFHQVLLEKMQAVRDEMAWELDRLEQLGAVATGYLEQSRPTSQLDVRR